MRILVIGGGYIGQEHLTQYRKMPDVEIAGLVDSKLEVSEVAKRYHTEFFHSVEYLNEDDFDVVDIDVPTIYHKDYSFWAASLGKDIICEKPLARGVKDAVSIIEESRKHHVRLFVGQVLRYYPEYIKAKKLVDSGYIGTPCTASTWRGGTFPRGEKDWYRDRNKSGGTVFDLVIHDFDFLTWTLGPVDEVFCRRSDQNNESAEYSVTILKFKSGAIADAHGFWSHGNFRTKFEISGTEGLLMNDSTKNPLLYSTSSYNLQESTSEDQLPDFFLKYDPMYAELRDFVDSIERKKESSVTEMDALQAVKIASAAEISAKTGNPVRVEEVLE
jgi:predicted dehydrogenase